MHELVQQAGENDNITTIYVVDDMKHFCGAIDLKDLIIARENVELDTLISYAYPYLSDREKISESIEKIKDYAEDSLPVLNKEKKIIGIIFNYSFYVKSQHLQHFVFYHRQVLHNAF